jgi:hypothetical protein
MADRAATSRPAAAAASSIGIKQLAEVVVVRHGETSWNASHIIQGQMDPELNETGRSQALVVRTVPRIMMQEHSKRIYLGSCLNLNLMEGRASAVEGSQAGGGVLLRSQARLRDRSDHSHSLRRIQCTYP